YRSFVHRIRWQPNWLILDLAVRLNWGAKWSELPFTLYASSKGQTSPTADSRAETLKQSDKCLGRFSLGGSFHRRIEGQRSASCALTPLVPVRPTTLPFNRHRVTSAFRLVDGVAQWLR